MTNEDEYMCANCGGVFGKGCTDEEALKDLEKDFPGVKPEECVLVCDDCYRELMKEPNEVRRRH